MKPRKPEPAPSRDSGSASLEIIMSLMLDLIVLGMLLVFIQGAAKEQELKSRIRGMELNARVILYFQDQIEKSQEIHYLPAAYSAAKEPVVYFDDLQAKTLYTGQKNSYQFLESTNRLRRRLYQFSETTDLTTGNNYTEIETKTPVLIRFTEIEDFSLNSEDGSTDQLRLVCQSGGERVAVVMNCHKAVQTTLNS